MDMTGLEILLTVIIWILIGCLICVKRKWYVEIARNSSNGIDDVTYCIGTILFMPFALVIALLREFIARDWNNF